MSHLPSIFTLEATASGSQARAGQLKTLHAEIQTPVFMPVGTHATVRAQNYENLEKIGYKIILGNTYHLHLQPGPNLFKSFGGIHNFMKWPNSVLTDSGGFQIFSLPNSRVMTEEGALFKSYINGDTILFTPEQSIETQKAINSDIMMALDQCIPSTANEKDARDAMDLTHRWAIRSLTAKGESNQALFGIVQGALYPNLRKESAEFITSNPFDGFAIGGLAVGEMKDERENCVEVTAKLLPKDKPRYLMGVGTPIDLLEAVHRGIDMFDCILPSALAWQGTTFSSQGKINLRRGIYKNSKDPIDKNCSCSTCSKYSRAYLHHLIKIGEPLGCQLVGLHSFQFYFDLMNTMRKHILDNTFLDFYNKAREPLMASDPENPVVKPKINPSRNSRVGRFEMLTRNGFNTVRDHTINEVMHSVINPTAESEALYVKQSKVVERLRGNLDPENKSELIIWDVGLGAAFNAMATINAAENLSELKRPLRIISFENDLDALKLVIKYHWNFPHAHHPAPGTLINGNLWQHKALPISWELIEGDFEITYLSAPIPDIIYWDFFSARSDQKLWSLKSWKNLWAKVGAHSTFLATYSASTAVRTGLLAAGFTVGAGVESGPKQDTTLAITPLAKSQYPEITLLGKKWLSRWEKSHARYPFGCTDQEILELDRLILSHPQFASLDLSSC